MSEQGKTQRMAMKRSASYNGFSFGLPCKIDELKIDDSVLGPSVFSGEWNLLFHKQGSPFPIRSPNHGVDCPISNGFPSGFDGLEKPNVSLTELSDASSGSDSAWQEEFLRLRRQEAAIEKDKARLDEEIKTLRLKLELEEDLRRNDKECMDILRGHISSLEGKLQCSEKKIRELEHERQRLEVSSVLTTTSTREFALVKARLDASQATVQALETDLKVIKGEKSKLESQRKESQDLVIKLEHQLSSANKELQRRENRINQLVEERRSLEDYQIKARSLQRKDQKSSYALQTQIVNLQEKLEISERANEELAKEKTRLQDKVNQLGSTIKELEGSYRSKLEQAIERLKTMKTIKSYTDEENHNSSVNEKSQDSCVSFSESDTSFILKKHCSALLVELNKQTGENSFSEADLEHLKSALNKFLEQLSNSAMHASQGAKFLDKPLRLGTVSKEPSQEQSIPEKGPQSVSMV